MGGYIVGVRTVLLCGMVRAPRQPVERAPRVRRGEDKAKSYARRYRWAKAHRAQINARRRQIYAERKK